MCLAVPPTSNISRGQQKHSALAQSLEPPPAAGPSMLAGADAVACYKAAHHHQQQRQQVDAAQQQLSTAQSPLSSVNFFGGGPASYHEPAAAPSTPPPYSQHQPQLLDTCVLTGCALGPTGLSPVLSRVAAGATAASAEQAAAGVELIVGGGSGPGGDGELSPVPLPSGTTPPYQSSSSTFSSRSPSAVTTLAAPTSTKSRRRRGPQRPGKTATDKERLFVKHDYHDLSLEPDSPTMTTVGGGVDFNSAAATPLALTSESFPMKLHRILEETAALGQSHLISWQPHGRAFRIRDPAAFSERIIPRYFPKMKKLTSLQRQFNLYGFERLTRDGPDAGAYYHEAFLRGRPGLSAMRMVRRRVKGTGYKAASNPDAEPDLYALPFMDEVLKKINVGALRTIQQGSHVNNCATVQLSGTNPYIFGVDFLSRPSHYYGTTSSDGGTTSAESTRASYSSNGGGSGEEFLASYQRYRDEAAVRKAPAQAAMARPRQSKQQDQNYTEDSYQALAHWVDSKVQQFAVTSSTGPGRLSQACYHDPSATTASATRTQESNTLLLQEYYSGLDVAPLSLPTYPQHFGPLSMTKDHTSSSSAARYQQGQQQQGQQDDHPILQEFADMWESNLFQLK